jgi:hypothetical protein
LNTFNHYPLQVGACFRLTPRLVKKLIIICKMEEKQEATLRPAKRNAKKNRIGKWIKKLLVPGGREPYLIEETVVEKLELEEVKFYLELAEKQLEDSVDTGQIITERSTNMLNLTSALLIALVAYSIDKWENNNEWTLLLKMAVWGCGILVLASGLLVAAILPKDYCIPGWTLDKILKSKSFKEGVDADTRQKFLRLNLLRSYESDTKENRSLNNKRWTLFNLSMLIIFLAPICFALFYLFFR